MVCLGSKPLCRKGHKSVDSADMDGGESSYRRSKKKGNDKKPRGGGQVVDVTGDVKKSNKVRSRPPKNNDKQQTVLRKKVDPETAKYFSEIAKLFEGNEVDLEERSAICGNALEETRGKEVELATDMIISHTLQSLLEGCDLEQLCGFLQNCAEDFSSIATDKFGSHVAESALKSLAIHLQEDGFYSMIEDTLNKIAQVVVCDAVNVMCSSYGSHVLRSLLCLCKGAPLATLEEFHVTKRSSILAERLSSRQTQSGGYSSSNFQHSFPVIFNFLVREMLNHAKDEIASLRVNKYSSFVLQATLKLLIGDDEELLHVILVLLRCDEKIIVQGKFMEGIIKQDIVALLEDTASSHLFEVIIEVAPELVYNGLLTEVFKDSLFEISSHQCGNFVVQALVSSARTKNHVDLIWEELGPKLKDLLEHGKSGVVGSILAACKRFQTNVHECCQALAAAVLSESESTSCIVPRILFLESYFRQKTCWMWPKGEKMHTLGCLMLQTILGCPNQFIQPYITSIRSMETDHIFEMAKDTGGNHVLEAFIGSEAPAKQKIEIITKLRDHFGELSKNPSSSFTVEKCFSASNVPMKESIAAELLAVQAELSKIKHGPYLLKKLDIDGFARQPEQWKRSQKSKENVYREFQVAFGSNSKVSEQTVIFPKPSEKKQRTNEKNESHGAIDTPISTPSLGSDIPGLEVSLANMGLPGNKQGVKRKSDAHATAVKDSSNKKFIRNSTNTSSFLRNSKSVRNSTDTSSFVRNPAKRKSPATELANLAGKPKLNSFEVQKLFRSASNDVKQSGNVSKPFLSHQKT